MLHGLGRTVQHLGGPHDARNWFDGAIAVCLSCPRVVAAGGFCLQLFTPPRNTCAELSFLMSVTLSSNISLSSHSPRREEDLINAYEYEEERITNSLFSKLEQVRIGSCGHWNQGNNISPHLVAAKREDSAREYSRSRERVAGEPP